MTTLWLIGASFTWGWVCSDGDEVPQWTEFVVLAACLVLWPMVLGYTLGKAITRLTPHETPKEGKK